MLTNYSPQCSILASINWPKTLPSWHLSQTDSSISAEQPIFNHSHMYFLVLVVRPSCYLLSFDPLCWEWLTSTHSMLYFSCVLSTLKYLLLLAWPFFLYFPPCLGVFLEWGAIILCWNNIFIWPAKPQRGNTKWVSWNRKKKIRSQANTQCFFHHIIPEGYDTLLPATVTHYYSNLGGGMPKKICCLKKIS